MRSRASAASAANPVKGGMFTGVGIFSAMIGDDMSETGVGASTKEKGAGLYDETGNRISSGAQTEQNTEALVRFAWATATVLAALILGYFLGKLF